MRIDTQRCAATAEVPRFADVTTQTHVYEHKSFLNVTLIYYLLLSVMVCVSVRT